MGLGLVIQIFGVLSLIASLITGVISIKTGNKSSLPIIFLVLGSGLITVGRRIYNGNHN